MFFLIRNDVVSARRCVPVICFVVRPILRILVTECRDFVIGGITTTYAFAGVVFIPTNFCASCIFFAVMFKIVTEFARCVSFQLNMAHGTFFIYASVLFTSCCNVNNPIARSMSGRGNGFICRISTAVTFTSVVCFPTRFGASRISLVVMFNVVTKCLYIGLCNDNFIADRAMLAFGFAFFSAGRGNCIINNFRMSECRNYGLFLQDCSAYRAMLSLCESRGCACWCNRIVYHFNVIACVFLPFHVNINVFC